MEQLSPLVGVVSREKAEPKDVFMHLLVIATLYASAAGFLVLLFEYINLGIPDTLEGRYYGAQSSLDSLRWSLAVLSIVFPVYILVNWFLARTYARLPGKRELRLRKWLLYFTLFAAALIIIGDIISLIFNFLQGELSTRFILKVAAVFFVAGSTLFYYGAEVRPRVAGKIGRIKYFAYGVIIIVVLTIGIGFFTVGSPFRERDRRLDEQRVQDLQFLQSEIVTYWQNKSRLPERLADIKDDIRGVRVPVDPQLQTVYEYNLTSPESFTLCATFTQASSEASSAVRSVAFPESSGSWEHIAGRVCFSRTIDRDVYKPHAR